MNNGVIVKIPLDVIFNHIFKKLPITQQLKLKRTCKGWYQRLKQELVNICRTPLFRFTLSKVHYAVVRTKSSGFAPYLIQDCVTLSSARQRANMVRDNWSNTRLCPNIEIKPISPPDNEYWTMICEKCGCYLYHWNVKYVDNIGPFSGKYEEVFVWHKDWINKDHTCK